MSQEEGEGTDSSTISHLFFVVWLFLLLAAQHSIQFLEQKQFCRPVLLQGRWRAGWGAGGTELGPPCRAGSGREQSVPSISTIIQEATRMTWLDY